MSETKEEYNIAGKENVLNKTKLVRIDKADHEWLKKTAYMDRLSIKEVVHKVINNYKENIE